MQFRKVLLRVMLGSLGVAAVVGAMAILAADQQVIWRVVGTAMATAGAAAILLGMSLLADHEKTRSAGLLGMGAVIVEFLLCVDLIWDMWLYLPWGPWAGELAAGATMLAVFLTVPPAMLLLRLRYVREGRSAAGVGLVLDGMVFLLLMVPSWAGWSWSDREQWYESALAVAAFGSAAVCSLVGIGTDRRYWRYPGLAACVAGLAMALVGIWWRLHEGSSLFIIVCSIAGAVAHANLAMMCPLKRGQLWLRYGTIACVLLTAVFIDYDAVMNPRHSSDSLMRLAGAGGFVAGCGSLALLVLARLNQKMGQRPVLAEIKRITLICPGCQKKQTLEVGQAQCPSCNLRIHVRIEEPRCPNCDYLLYMLQSDRCPECGEPIQRSAPPSCTSPAAP